MRPPRQIPARSPPQSRPEPVVPLGKCDGNKGNTMSRIHKRAIAAVVGAFALVTAPAVVDLPGTDAGAAFAKKGGNGGGNGGGGGRGNGGGGGKSSGGGGKGSSAKSGGGGKGGGSKARSGGGGGGFALFGNRKGKGGAASTTRSGTKSAKSGGSTTGKVKASPTKTKAAPAGSTSKRRSVAEVQEMTATSIAPVERPAKNNHGALASELKGLNAAHASEQAFANASPNSRVGRIAAYRNAVLGAAGAGAALTEAEAALLAFDAETPEGPTSAEIDEQIAAYSELDELTPEQEEELALLREAYDAALQAEADREAERETLVAAVDAARTEADTAGSSIEDLFLAASDGRMLSPEALEEFHRLLGIEEEAASLRPEEEPVEPAEEEVEPVSDDGGDDPIIIIEEEPTDVSGPALPEEEAAGSL